MLSVLPQDPLGRLLAILSACGLGILVAAFILVEKGQTVMERMSRFLVFCAYLFLGAVAARQLFLWLNARLSFFLLQDVADTCYWIAAAALGGIALVAYTASEEAKAKAIQDFFRPLVNMKNVFGSVVVNGRAAIGNSNSHIVQSATVNVQEEIHALIDRIQTLPVSELQEQQQKEALEHLHTLAYQTMLPPARREPSKIASALQRLPAIFSGVASCAEAWDKMLPIIKAHLGG